MGSYNAQWLLKHRTIFLETASDPIFIVNSDGHLLKTNTPFNALLGYEENELTGRLFTDIIHTSTLVKKRTSHSKLHHFMRSSESPIEMQLLTKRGKPVEVKLRSIIVRNNNDEIMQAIGVAEDLNEHKKKKSLEQKVWETRETLHSVLSNSGDGILVVDANGTITIANEALLQMLGYREEEVIEKHLTEISPYTGTYTTTLGEEVVITDTYVNNQVEKADELFEKCKISNYEIYLVKKDGRLVPVDVTCSILQDSNGRRRGSISICRDITERKQIEKTLQNTHRELEKRVEERTANLKLANKQLKQEISERRRVEKKLITYQQQLRTLASEVSLAEERERRRIATNIHDRVGQALSIAKMKLGVLKKNIPSQDLVESLNEIHGLIAHTIKDTRMLIFELMPPVLYELGFEAALKDLAGQFSEQYDIKVRLHDDMQPKPLDYQTRVLLFQATRELLTNVVKHAKTLQAGIYISREGENLRIDVEDNGIGFDTSETDTPTGTTGGFGLFSIRERVNYLGGRLQVSSAPGRGTSVSLVFPLTRNGNIAKESMV